MASFKYSELYTFLKTRILNGEFENGQQIPTELELSRQFALSRDTVRKAISILEGEGLLYKIKGSGTYVRCEQDILPIEKTASRRVGIMMNDVDSYIFSSIVKGIDKVLDENGYFASIQITGNQISKEKSILEGFINDDYAGLIIEPTKAALPQLNYELYKKLSVLKPTVLIHAKIPTLPISSITMGDDIGAQKLAEYLLGLGYKKISIFCKFDEQTGSARYLGFVRAFQHAGVQIPDSAIHFFPSENLLKVFADPLDGDVRAALETSDAIICHDDRMALSLKRYLAAHDEFNRNILICGFDDSEIAKDYNFISVAHPKDQFGERAARSLLDKIKNPAHDVSFDFDPDISLNEP